MIPDDQAIVAIAALILVSLLILWVLDQ